MKFCPGCRTEKRADPDRELSEFGHYTSRYDGYGYQCLKCAAARMRARGATRKAAGLPARPRPSGLAEGSVDSSQDGSIDIDLNFEDPDPFDDIPTKPDIQVPSLNQASTAPPAARIEVVPETITQIEEHRLKRRLRELEAEKKSLIQELEDQKVLFDLAREAKEQRISPLEVRERASGKREGCVLVMASDLHVEETVTKESVNGLNEHNPDIARLRIERLFSGARWLTEFARQSHLVRDMRLWLGGDCISGHIHEDLTETNSMGVPQAVAFAEQLIGDGIDHLLEDPQLEHVGVVCSTGNHGRLTKKMRVHTRNETNIEWLLYLCLARRFAKEPRVTFDLPNGILTYFKVYGRIVRALHGDPIKYSGALGGITNPINRALAGWDDAIQADLTIMGHHHTYMDTGKWIVNGSSVGFGPFSEWIRAKYERPQQAWALLDSRRWRSLNAPIWLGDEDEGPSEAVIQGLGAL